MPDAGSFYGKEKTCLLKGMLLFGFGSAWQILHAIRGFVQ